MLSAWKLRQSPLVREIYAAPGNAGIAEIADCVNIGVADIIELADFAEKLKIDLTIVGPELPLTLGIVDEFQKRGMAIFGPTRLAAELEGSKAFSKEFMRKYGIPTAEARVCSSMDEAKAALKEFRYPAVIKVDGLASGKGVVIVNSKAEGEEYLKLVFEEKKFGNAANRILVEEFLTGEEVSFMALTDGKKFVSLAPAKDYKKAFDGETGPNTGGMGAHSPAVILSGEDGRRDREDDHHADDSGDGRGGPAVHGMPLRRRDADGERPESARVQLPLRRSRNAGADAPPRRRSRRPLPQSRPRQPRRHQADLEKRSRRLRRHRRRRLPRRFPERPGSDDRSRSTTRTSRSSTPAPIPRDGKMINAAGRVASVCAQRHDALRGAGEGLRSRAESAVRRGKVPKGHRVPGAGAEEGVALRGSVGAI